MGEWLRVYGTSICGGPVSPRGWGVTTQRGDTVFVHALNWPDRVLALPDFGAKVLGATTLADGARVDVAQTASGVTLTMPAAADSVHRVIVLRTQGRTP